MACCICSSLNSALNTRSFQLGSRYGYACPDAIKIKGSVCQGNSVLCAARGVTIMCYGCNASGFRLDSHLADFRFVFFLFAFFQV